MNIVLIEDNLDLRRSLADFLLISGHEVSEAGSAIELYRLMGEKSYDVAVVDINLPHHDGFSITKYLSQSKLCSVIITSVRDAVADRVHGYQCGADIYMVKPVEPEELAAAIDRLGTRQQPEPEKAPEPSAEVWTYDAGTRRLWPPGRRSVSLTARETQLISIFVEADGAILKREDILAGFAETDSGEARGRIDTLISRLRSKVRKISGRELPLATVHNAGLEFSVPLRRR